MIAFAAALLAFIGSAFIANAEGNKTSVATCFVNKIIDDEEIGPKFVIGWRYREADRGAVAYPASDIHDPGNLLQGRSIHNIIDGPELRLFLIAGDPSRNLSPIALGYSKSRKGETIAGGIMANVKGSVQSVYFGNCVVKDYGASSDTIFAKLRSYGAHEFQ